MEKKTDRRSLRSKTMLQKALLTLLRKKKYVKITISEITREADLARVTFYAHFKSKDDLLASYLENILEAKRWT